MSAARGGTGVLGGDRRAPRRARAGLPTEVLMAGFGGQGMLLAGKLLAQAAMDVGLEVSWLPSYGPEMRGGTANVIVCLSQEPIGSPLVARPAALVAMNRPSLEKFAPMVRPGGTIVVNRTLIDCEVGRDDCTVIDVRSREAAQEAANERAANLVMLGAWVGAAGVLAPEAVEAAIEHEFDGERAKLAPSSVAAFGIGVAIGRRAAAGAPPADDPAGGDR